MKIKVKVIPTERIEVLSPDGKSCGKLNEVEFLDLRCQIKDTGTKGFHFYYKGEKIYIRKDGLLSKWIPLFMDSVEKYNYLLGL